MKTKFYINHKAMFIVLCIAFAIFLFNVDSLIAAILELFLK